MSAKRAAGAGASRRVSPGEVLTVRQLQCLVAVANTGGFSSAARSLYMSQPALSAQIQGAERVLGVKLFDRGARSVRPTAAGLAAVGRARVALRAVEAVTDAVRWSDVVRIGAIETVGPYLFGPWLAAARAEGAAVVRPRLGLTAELIDDLDEGRLDAVVLATPAPGRFLSIPLGPERLALVVGADDDLEGPAVVGDLAEREMLLLGEGHCLADAAIDLCAASGVEGPHEAFEGSSLATLVEMVASGLGATIVAQLAAGSLAGRSDVRVVPFAPGGPSRSLSLVRRPDSGVAAELEELARIASRIIASA